MILSNCLERDFYAHLGGIPVPQKVKQKECHGDPGEHHCDVYEMPRNPNPVPSGDEFVGIDHLTYFMGMLFIYRGDASLEVLQLGY
ncbi:hypothetical protein OIU84_017826 [Salix udensis]|uniref:Uncharacterized protein n=1 Tax=Salix udensis TaxID=889485 RepID=A0AAD6L2R2_9ROSI|nr:hypothetical protein OIU84_017826 [Salix udensis]